MTPINESQVADALQALIDAWDMKVSAHKCSLCEKRNAALLHAKLTLANFRHTPAPEHVTATEIIESRKAFLENVTVHPDYQAEVDKIYGPMLKRLGEPPKELKSYRDILGAVEVGIQPPTPVDEEDLKHRNRETGLEAHDADD